MREHQAPSGRDSGQPPDRVDAYEGLAWAISQLHNKARQAYWKSNANWEEILDCLEKAIACLDELTGDENGDDDCPFPACPGTEECKPRCGI